MFFKNLALAHFFNCLLNFHLFFFTEDLVENFDEICSSLDVSSFEDSDYEPSSISESSDESSSLSLSHSSEDELYFIFIAPIFLCRKVLPSTFLVIFIFCLAIAMTLAQVISL